MKILAIETSCDETAAAVVENTTVLSNAIWSQIKLHQSYGGVMPSVAKRAHEDKIDEVVTKALKQAGVEMPQIDAIAVTQGPGLAIALEVGITHAKHLAQKYSKPIIGVNHIEGHILSAYSPTVQFPAVAIIVSGKHTELTIINAIGDYHIVAKTQDDALGEALDKAARMLGLGYPGGPILEKMAKLGDPKRFPLPRPMAGRESENSFSYSGLKSAMWRLVEEQKPLDKQKIYDLAAVFQKTAFEHLIRVSRQSIANLDFQPTDLLVGGGVVANVELRTQIRALAKEIQAKAYFPINKKLCGDNAAMVGIVAHFKAERNEFSDPNNLDRLPRWKVDA